MKYNAIYSASSFVLSVPHFYFTFLCFVCRKVVIITAYVCK